MDVPIKEQQIFQNVTCNSAASEDEITESQHTFHRFYESCKIFTDLSC